MNYGKNKYLFNLLAILSSIVFVVYYLSISSNDFQQEIDIFQEQIIEKERQLSLELEKVERTLYTNDIASLWEDVDTDNDVYTHVYHNDSLLFWNTNHLPIIRFKNIQFPSEGLVHLQNGWYICKTKILGRYTIVSSYLLKREYSYTNKDLVNEFNPEFSLSFDADLSLLDEGEFLINDKEGKFLFSLLPYKNQTISDNTAILGMLILVLVHSLWIIVLFKTLIHSRFKWAFPFILILFRTFSIHFNWLNFLDDTIITDPDLYATNYWFPNFYHFSLNIIYLAFISYFLRKILENTPKSNFGKFLGLFLFLCSFGFYYVYHLLVYSLIQNSTIQLEIEKFFDLTVISILAFGFIGLFFYIHFSLVKSIISLCKKQGISSNHLAVLSFILSFFYVLFDITYGFQVFASAIFPMIFYAVLLYTGYKKGKSYSISFGVVLLLLFSVISSSLINDLNAEKDLEERKIYANQLATEKNIATELEYNSLSDKIHSDRYLKKFIGKKQNVISSVFHENIERRFFLGYWERYEFDFYFFDSEHKPIIDDNSQTDNYGEINNLISEYGEVSTLNSSIYFITGNAEQYSYIIRETIYNKDSVPATFIATLKSKKIPEEIGFPRLLISSKTNVLESIENYSIAKYHNNQLTTKYGAYHYPSSYTVILPKSLKQSGAFDYGGYNHYALKKEDGNLILLSNKKLTLLEKITSFSFLFSLYGLLLLPLMLNVNRNKKFKTTFTLSLKIQVVLIGLVFISLLSFGWGSGLFVKNQYNEFTNDVIREKLNSVEFEIKAKLGKFDNLSIAENGNYMEYILRKFSNVFFTDINMYDKHGYILATSRPKVYNVGLLSEQMNPQAYVNMSQYMKSQFVQQERIGNLNYTSAYKPFYNANGILMGYINLQHFGQQREFENQIQKFLVAIINVFVLLLAVSVILAVFISNWLTSPLRFLQENLAQVKFGERNMKIEYNREDEIGALVKEYNKKLDDLQSTAEQLAQSEREGAWREMAKQVAHEIKNPLTPMKLRVQQLLRVYDPNDPKSKERLASVGASLIEQIDALTKIANEFSNFARMPKPNLERVEISELVENVINLFNTEKAVSIVNEGTKEKLFVLADKDQLVRVFNNLIKNAIQAIPSDKKGHINIRIERLGNHVQISFQDDGIGINKDLQSKIFAPNFTTKSTGTGLGLAMVQQIVTNHQGTIHFHSEVNVGSEFVVRFPLWEDSIVL